MLSVEKIRKQLGNSESLKTIIEVMPPYANGKKYKYHIRNMYDVLQGITIKNKTAIDAFDNITIYYDEHLLCKLTIIDPKTGIVDFKSQGFYLPIVMCGSDALLIVVLNLKVQQISDNPGLTLTYLTGLAHGERYNLFNNSKVEFNIKWVESTKFVLHNGQLTILPSL